MGDESDPGMSFDPRTWVVAEAADVGSSTDAPFGARRRWPIAAAAGAAILLIGAGIAWSQRPDTPRPGGPSSMSSGATGG